MGLYGNTARDVENDIISVVNAAIKSGAIDLSTAGTSPAPKPATSAAPAPKPDAKAKGKK